MVLGYSTFTTPLLPRNSSFLLNYQISSDGLQFKLNNISHHGQVNFTNNRLSWRDLLPQILSSVIAFMLVILAGINMVYSNIFLHHNEFSDFSELSWLTSILVLCTPIGAIMVGLMMDRIGRKNACLLTSVPFLLSWSISSVYNPECSGLFYMSRIFAGIGGGMTSMVVVYVSEISHSSYRQVLLSLNSVFFTIGILFGTAVGSLVSWYTVNVIFVGCTVVIMILIVIFLPESPAWLIKFRPDKECKTRRSLKTIYPHNNQVYEEEWRRLKKGGLASVETDNERCLETLSLRPVRNGSCSGQSDRGRKCRVCLLFGWPQSVRKPMWMLATVFLLQQLSGGYPVMFYTVPIFKSVVGDIDGTEDDGGPTAAEAMIMLGVIRLVTSVVACALSLHVGRRPLLIYSSLAMACSAALVASTCPRGGSNPLDRPVAALPLVGVAAFVCSGSMGVLVFPWTLVGELLPVSARAVAGGLLVSYAYALMFIVIKVFPRVYDPQAGGFVAGTFFAFAIVSLVLAAYVHRFLPETLAKQPHEIEQNFVDPPSNLHSVRRAVAT